jgi:hypothetical protein
VALYLCSPTRLTGVVLNFKLLIMNIVIVRNFEVISDKFNVKSVLKK